jgi:hypothetical protein
LEDVWHRMAINTIDCNASVENWLSAQVSASANAFLAPELMTGEHAKKAYQAFDETAFKDAEILLAGQAETYLARVKHDNPKTPAEMEAILTNYRLEFNPEFVWCRAKLGGLTALAEKYEQRALRRLSNTAIRAAYKKWFPELIDGKHN